MKKLTAKDITWRMRCHVMRQNHEWITPNAKLYAWESDLLSVTRSNYVHEFEIKVSKGDLMRDLRKDKHKAGMLLNGHFQDRYKFDARGALLGKTIAESKELNRQMKGATGCRRPNYFSFAMPDVLYDKIDPSMLPTYTGIYTVDHRNYVREVRKPPLLHKGHIEMQDLHELARKIHYRYWNEIWAERYPEPARPSVPH